ncbi:MAG: RNA polymerase sigma factor RpoD/SigA [Succinivibrionaceae bacterium]
MENRTETEKEEIDIDYKINDSMINKYNYCLSISSHDLLSPEDELKYTKIIFHNSENLRDIITDSIFVIGFVINEYHKHIVSSQSNIEDIMDFVICFIGEQNDIEDSDNDFLIVYDEKFKNLENLYNQLKLAFEKKSTKSEVNVIKEELKKLLKTIVFAPIFYDELIKKLDVWFGDIVSICKPISNVITKYHIVDNNLFQKKEYILVNSPIVKANIIWLTPKNRNEISSNKEISISFGDVDILDNTLEKISGIEKKYFHKIDEIIDYYNNIKEKYIEGKKARDMMILSNTRLVMHEARRFLREDMDVLMYEDLCQYGIFGLIRAIEKFDYRKGYKFSTYAINWIRQSIGRAVENNIRTIRLPINKEDKLRKIINFCNNFKNKNHREATDKEVAEELDISLYVVTELRQYVKPILSTSVKNNKGEEKTVDILDTIVDERIPTPFQDVEHQNLVECINKALASLAPREADIIRKRFGIGVNVELTLEEIGKIYNIKAERIRQIENTTLYKLAMNKRFAFLRDFLSVSSSELSEKLNRMKQKNY